MKTIEEKSREFAESLQGECLHAPWNKIKPILSASYREGANDALESQWISVEDELPRREVDVLVVYKDEAFDAYAWAIANYQRNEGWWYSADDDCTYSQGNIIAWMPIPECKFVTNKTVLASVMR